MGRLVEQPIKTIFNGVSRQPHTVRLLGQVEEATNVGLSVVTGGFTTRPANHHIAVLQDADPTKNYGFHAIDRDDSERYVVLTAGDGGLLIYDALTGAKKTVNVADGTRFFVKEADATQTGVVATRRIAYAATETAIDLQISGVAGGLQVVVKGSNTGTFSGEETTLHTFTADGSQTVAIYPYIRVEAASAGTGTFSLTGTFADTTYLLAARAEDLVMVSVADYTFTTNTKTPAELEPASSGTITGYKKAFADLPATGNPGDIYKITGDATPFDDYYVTWDATSSSWVETVNPNGHNAFDAATMPHELVREADGTFTLEQAFWDERKVGDEDTVKAPPFVDRTISDLVFHRNRLIFLADENVFSSQAGDYFNLWPDKATEVLDSDPIDSAATTNRVSILRFGVPFRKSLFLTSLTAQFELTAFDKLTPNTAVVDEATTYHTSARCRPVTMGDELYFATNGEGGTQVWEYFWDEDRVSNTAANITKHCSGYIPPNPIMMASAPAEERLFVLTEDDPNSIYVYTTYWDDDKKAQSAWAKWEFPGLEIIGITTFGNWLYLVGRRDGAVTLERVAVSDELIDENLSFAPRLDRRVSLTGTYDSGADKTTWTLPYDHGGSGVIAVLSGDFPEGERGRALNITYPSANQVTASGDFSAAPVYFGYPFLWEVEFSRQYVRDEREAAIITGRCQMRSLTVSFQDSGPFSVEITPLNRAAKVHKMTGRMLGDALNQVGAPSIIARGAFKVPVRSRADTVIIKVKGDSHIPTTVTGATWSAFFNEITRQG